jgi:hypothetical protein
VGQITTIAGTDTIEVNDGNSFAVVFDRNDGGGITKLYDLASDPGRTRNLGPQPGYTVFNSYLYSNGYWSLIGSTRADVFEVYRASPESATIHVLTHYGCELLQAGKTCPLSDLKSESWTTLYPKGQVFFERRIITPSASHTLDNVAAESIDLCHCSSWNGIYDGVASDTTYPSGSNVHAGNGSERWWGQYQHVSGPGGTLGVSQASFLDSSFGFVNADMRLIVGTSYLRSHVVPRSEGTVPYQPNTILTARFEGWLSERVNSATSRSLLNDYRSPSISVAAGSLAGFDAEPGGSAMVSGYNPATGRYVLTPDGTGRVNATVGFPSGVSVRFRPDFKLLAWPTTGQAVTWGGKALVAGTDYVASRGADGALRIHLNFDVVPGAAGSGQRSAAALDVRPSGPPAA